MREKSDLNMLENADDKTVELLSGVPVLTDEEKERMLAMSKKKLDKMNRESNININEGADQVSGVERYSRPKWRIAATVAACFVIAGGVAGTALALGKNRSSFNDPMTEMTTTIEATTEAPATAAEPTAADPEAMTDEELNDVAVYLIDRMSDIDSMASGTGGYIAPAAGETQTYRDADGMIYTRVEGCDSTAPVEDYLRSVLSGSLYKSYSEMLLGAEKPYYIEYDGMLYYRETVREGRFHFTGDPVVSDYAEKTFIITIDNEIPGCTETIKFYAALDNGEWKLEDYTIAGSDPADTGKGYTDAELEQIAADSTKILNELFDMSYGRGIETDSNDTILYNETEGYSKVTDERIASIDDVADFIDQRACAEIKDMLLATIKGQNLPGCPIFLEQDGKLYCWNSELKGLKLESNISITEATDSYISFEADIADNMTEMPGYEDMIMEGVLRLDNGNWKLAEYKVRTLPRIS